jgi:hypothetical protein
MQVLFIILAVLALVLWSIRSWRPKKTRVRPGLSVAELAAQSTSSATPAQPETDVKFRMQGERGMGGPIFGDVLCSDGVYLPHVWESDFHTSFDGRWIRTGSYGDSVPRLMDRKNRRCWLLSVAEASAVDDLHWRLPRWGGVAESGNGVAAEAHHALTDAAFDTWLTKHVSKPAQPLVAVCDLWIPADCVPESAQAMPPELPQHDAASVQVSLQRHWPTTLRDLSQPLEPLLVPQWQIMLNGETHSWVLDHQSPFVWRADGQAFACYGYPLIEGERKTVARLGVWSQELGGQHWGSWMPEDRKPWTLLPHQPQEGSDLGTLSWDGDVLQQRMDVDTPELDRLHDGRSISCTVSAVRGIHEHRLDGRFKTKVLPTRTLQWRRNLFNPSQWQAQSMPVAGQPLVWTLVHDAKDETGATAAYAVLWGEHPLPGVWELEHTVVDSRWALLLAWSDSVLQGGKTSAWAWDGKQLNAIDIPWAVVRMRPSAQPGKAQVLLMVGCGPDSNNYASSGIWRWPLQIPDATNLTKPGWTPAYEWREIGVNAQGVWQLLPRWREVKQIQHPCSDGDYVWRQSASRDALWWWGGLHNNMNNHWDPKSPRCEGVMVTQSGAVVCGMGPSACPHHGGDGWLFLEWLARGQDEPHYWKLHWLRPSKHEIWSLELRAYMPVIQSWEAQLGIKWVDVAQPQAAPQSPELLEHVIAPMRWEEAHLEMLKQSPAGLWVRKQDAVYADAIILRDDWPWEKPAAVVHP